MRSVSWGKIISLHVSLIFIVRVLSKGQETKGPQKISNSNICVLQCQWPAQATILRLCILQLSLSVDYQATQMSFNIGYEKIRIVVLIVTWKKKESVFFNLVTKDHSLHFQVMFECLSAMELESILWISYLLVSVGSSWLLLCLHSQSKAYV